MLSLCDIEFYDVVLVLGEDIIQIGVCVVLVVCQVVKGKVCEMVVVQKVVDWQIVVIFNIGQCVKYLLFVINVDDICLDDIVVWIYCVLVEDQVCFGFVIVYVLDDSVLVVDGLSQDLQGKVDVIVQVLVGVKKLLIIFGINVGSMEIIQVVVNVVKVLKGCGVDVGVIMVVWVVNSVGLGMIGGGLFEEVLDELESGVVDVVIVLENDFYCYVFVVCVDVVLVKVLLVMVVDYQCIVIMDKVYLVFFVVSFVESDGIVVNNEGCVQCFFQVYDLVYYDVKIVMLESWCWLYLLYSIVNNCQVDWIQLDYVIDVVIVVLLQLVGIKDVVLDVIFCICGQKLVCELYCYSGCMVMCVNISVYELCQLQDKDMMFVFFMEGNNQLFVLCLQILFVWVLGWNFLQVWNKFQDEVGGKLCYGDLGVCLFEVFVSGLEYFMVVLVSFQVEEGKW